MTIVTKGGSLSARDARMGYVMIAPMIIGILFFTIIPVLFSLYISFTDWDMLSDWTFNGFKNYETMFSGKMLKVIWSNTLQYIAYTLPGSLVCGLLLALALNRSVKGIGWFRTAFFLPNITTTVAVCAVWAWLYDKNYGLFNVLLENFGLESVSWLNSTKNAMRSISIMSIWQTMGYDMLIFLAGLKSIDVTYYEAARMDGANSFQQFWNVTLPMLTPTVFYLIVMHLIGFFQVFDAPYVMTDGGPGHATTTIVMHIYETAFTYYRMGEASAYAWVLFVVIMLVTAIQFSVQKKWVSYDA